MLINGKWIDSKIVSEDIPKRQKRLFTLVVRQSQRSQTSFRASQHNFDAAEFHKACDGEANTVTLIRNELGKTITAFTPLSLNSTDKYLKDDTRQSFLLQLDLKEKMTLIQGEETYAVEDSKAWGPSFGKGHDLRISDKCNTNIDSFSQLPTSYNNDFKYLPTQESYFAFAGFKMDFI